MKAIFKAMMVPAVICLFSGTTLAQNSAQDHHQRYMDAVNAKRAANGGVSTPSTYGNTPAVSGYQQANKGIFNARGEFCPELVTGYACPDGFVPKKKY